MDPLHSPYEMTCHIPFEPFPKFSTKQPVQTMHHGSFSQQVDLHNLKSTHTLTGPI